MKRQVSARLKACYCPNRLEFRRHADSIDALRSEPHFNQDSIVRDPQFADRSRGDLVSSFGRATAKLVYSSPSLL